MSSQQPADPTEQEFKGGHAPAVKVAGGVRITQHKKRQEEEPEPPKPKEEGEEEEEPIAQAPAPEERRLIISGVLAKGDKDFPPEAIKAFHEKPMPAHQSPHAAPPRNIQQPRK